MVSKRSFSAIVFITLSCSVPIHQSHGQQHRAVRTSNVDIGLDADQLDFCRTRDGQQ